MVRRIPILAAALLFPIVTSALPGGRGVAQHAIVTPAAPLSAADRDALAARGVDVERVLSGNRYVVRLRGAAGAAAVSHLGAVVPLGLSDKIHASAWHSAAEARAFARLRIFFHSDATFDEARASVENAGGAIDDPLAYSFQPLHSVVVRIPPTSMTALAADDSVLAVFGARRFVGTNLNAISAGVAHVTDVQAPPYSLSGDGVALSYFELGPGLASHAEFGGRLTVHFTCGSSSSDPDCNSQDNQGHATHTAGTMIATGIMAEAKGMAPKATLNGYRAADSSDAWLDQKAALKSINSVADSNSWGFITNWCPSSTCTPTTGSATTSWVWTGDYAGAYDGFYNATLDHVAADTSGIPPLFVHSAGNDATTAGPTDTFGRHNHIDDNFNVLPQVYCYSQNGSGTDCPSPCTAGAQFCETTRHPTYLPYGSIGILASSKNVVAVAAMSAGFARASFSSCGPTKDGRLKPELAAVGLNVLSTWTSSGCDANPPPSFCYNTESGTSMAAPVVAGSTALFVEQWRKVNRGANPTPLVLKALAIEGADDIGPAGPDYQFGYGSIDAKNTVDLIIADGGNGTRVKSNDTASTGSSIDYPITVSSAQDLRVVLTWFDPELLALASDPPDIKTLINDLDLKVVDPSGNTVLPWVLDPAHPTNVATRGVDSVNNTEEVEIKGAAAGTYHAIVTGKAVPQGPQSFVVAANASIGNTAAPCVDPTEPNDTTATAFPLVSGVSVAARICSSTDVDYFKMVTSGGGAAASVTATDVALKVTITDGSGTTLATGNVAAGATGTITYVNTALIPNPPPTVILYVRVEPQGAVAAGANGGYELTPSFTFIAQPRRRSSH